MKKFNSLSEPMKIAYITGAATIVAAIIGAIIGGIFLLRNTAAVQPTPTATTSITATSTLPASVTSTATPQITSTVSTPNATATVNARQMKFFEITSGLPAYANTLNNGDVHWPAVSVLIPEPPPINFSHALVCGFKDGAYHAIVLQPSAGFRNCFTDLDYSNFVYQIHMTILQGDVGGITFRYDGGKIYYDFHIKEDGVYALDINDNNGSRVLSSGSLTSTMFNAGLNQDNQLAVLVNGNEIDLYVNNQYIATAIDSTSGHGRIGVMANDNPTDVSFSKVKVWLV